MYARVTTFQTPPDRLEDGVRTFQEQTVPMLRGQPGFRNVYLLANRQQGTVLVIGLWESEDAMRRSEQLVEQGRTQAAQQVGAGTPTVERYEVLVQG